MKCRYEHLLVAGGRVLNFNPAPLLLLLLVTPLLLVVFLLRRSKPKTKVNQEHSALMFAAPGCLSSYLVFRRLPSSSEPLTSSLRADPELESDFLKSESEESSLSAGKAKQKHQVNVSEMETKQTNKSNISLYMCFLIFSCPLSFSSSFCPPLCRLPTRPRSWRVYAEAVCGV